MSSDGTQGPIVIHGIRPNDTNKPPSRIELRDMKKNNPDQWNLFLLGMERFMDTKRTKESAPLSYFQIAGIHGRPYNNWPDEKWNEDEKIVDDTGYCTHSSILFLPWHRPYLSLFETTLYKHVNDIAREYGPDENRDRYIKASEDFRLPYWDWARPTDNEITLFPKEVWATEVHLAIKPGSKNTPKPLNPNPLAGYEFGEVGQGDSEINKFPKTNRTLRSPNKDQTSTETVVAKRLEKFFNENSPQNPRSKGKNLTERTLWILQAYKEFDPMSQNKWVDKSKTWTGWGSVEDIHNSVHVNVGSGGHMNFSDVSAFDPIFWLHHCNIDRLFAIWQALHDDNTDITYVTPQDGTSTRSISPGDMADKHTPLAPFNASETKGDYWTSEKIKDTKTFGYVYPETRDWVFPSKGAINRELERVYGRSSLASTVLASGADSENAIEKLKSRARLHQQVVNTSLDTQTMLEAVQNNAGNLPQEIIDQGAKLQLPADRDVSDLISDNKYLEWLVDIKAEKHANNGDFVVHFFLDEPEDNNTQLYIFNPSHVATFSTFGQGGNTGCKKCQDDQAARLEVTGQIPLTLGLVERYLSGQVDGLDVASVEDYLKQHLHWRVTTRLGELIGRDQIQSLLIGVVTNEVTLPTDPTGRPQYAPNVVPRPAVTTRANGEPRGDGTGFIGGQIPTVAV